MSNPTSPMHAPALPPSGEGATTHRWNGRLLLTLVIMVVYLWGHGRLASMDDRLFERSPAGMQALGSYLVGDYASAGRAYGTLVSASGGAGLAVRATTDGFADRLLARALDHARRGEVEQAVRTMHNVLWLDPPGTGSAARVFEVMAAAGDFGRAPRRERPAALLAALHAHLRRLDPGHASTARAYAEDAIARGELVPESYVTLSILHDDTDEVVQARDTLARALALAPAHPSVRTWAAIHAHRHGDVLSTYRHLRAAWAATPRDPAAGAALELLLTKLGDTRELQKLATERAAARPEARP